MCWDLHTIGDSRTLPFSTLSRKNGEVSRNVMEKGMKILNLNLFNGFHQTILAAEFMGVQHQPRKHLQPLESINCANSNISFSLTLSSFSRRLFLCFRCSTGTIVSQESIEKFSAQLNWNQFIVFIPASENKFPWFMCMCLPWCA